MHIPDMIDPVIGWRAWNVKADSSGTICLFSPQQKTPWPPGEKIEAQRTGKKEEGINAFSNAQLVSLRGYDVAPAVGQVALWGTVNEYAHGFRADFAYPVRLWATEKRFEALVSKAAQGYGVPYMGLAPVSSTKWPKGKLLALVIALAKAFSLVVFAWALRDFPAGILLISIPMCLALVFWIGLVLRWDRLAISSRYREYGVYDKEKGPPQQE